MSDLKDQQASAISGRFVNGDDIMYALFNVNHIYLLKPEAFITRLVRNDRTPSLFIVYGG